MNGHERDGLKARHEPKEMGEMKDDGTGGEERVTRDMISDEELSARVIYTLFMPSVRIARHFSVDLATMKSWLEMAYFHELRKEDLKQREIADVMGVSMSKVSLLSRQLKGNFLRAEKEEELPRRIEFMLWAEPLSLLKLKQVLPDVASEEIEEAVAELERAGRIVEEGHGTTTAYRLVIQTDRRVWDSWVARVDGLQDALSNVTNVIYGRFFAQEPAAFARTLSFRLLQGRVDVLRKLYEEHIFRTIVELDEEAGEALAECEASHEGKAAIEELSLSLFWAPYQYIKRQLGGAARGEEDDG